jgi:hypothetical protein
MRIIFTGTIIHSAPPPPPPALATAIVTALAITLATALATNTNTALATSLFPALTTALATSYATATTTTTANADGTALALAIWQNEYIQIRRYWNTSPAILADLWGTVNTIIIPNGDNCNANIGNGSGGIKGGGATTTRQCPHLLPSLVVLVIVIVFDATSLLPTMAPANCGILPPLGGDNWQRDGDHGGGIPLTSRGGTADVGSC